MVALRSRQRLPGRFALSEKEISWYCDPATRTLFDFGRSVEATLDTGISRMVIDLNRPPLPLPPKDPDGIIKIKDRRWPAGLPARATA